MSKPKELAAHILKNKSGKFTLNVDLVSWELKIKKTMEPRGLIYHMAQGTGLTPDPGNL